MTLNFPENVIMLDKLAGHGCSRIEISSSGMVKFEFKFLIFDACMYVVHVGGKLSMTNMNFVSGRRPLRGVLREFINKTIFLPHPAQQCCFYIVEI